MQAKHTTASILGLRSGRLLVAAAIAGGPTLASRAGFGPRKQNRAFESARPENGEIRYERKEIIADSA